MPTPNKHISNPVPKVKDFHLRGLSIMFIASNKAEISDGIFVFDVNFQADRDHLSIEAFFYTKHCQWLDVVELEFQAGPEKGTIVQV